MYASIRRYKTDKPETMLLRANKGFLPIVSKEEGFIAFYAIHVAEGEVISVSIFQTQAGAEESNRLALEFNKERIDALLSGPPEIVVGEVMLHKTYVPVG